MADLKKGFSLVELLVIVAVIGILAAMIIPAFVDVPNETRGKSDKNTVETLNTRLEADEALDKDFDNVSQVRTALARGGYSGASLIPDTKDCCFVWDNGDDVKSVLMVDLKNDKVIYPERFEGKAINDGDWYFIDIEPAPENNQAAYPSPVATARSLFAEWATEDTPTVDSIYVVSINPYTFTYNGKEYEKNGGVAYATFLMNGVYADGTKGPKLGDVGLTRYVRYDLYDGRVDGEEAFRIGCLLYSVDQNEQASQLAVDIYFDEAPMIDRTFAGTTYHAYCFNSIKNFRMSSSADSQYEIRPE